MNAKVHIKNARNGQGLCGAVLVLVQGDLLEQTAELVQPSTKFLARATCARCRAIRLRTNARVSP